MKYTDKHKYSFSEMETLVCAMLYEGLRPLVVNTGMPEIDSVVGFNKSYIETLKSFDEKIAVLIGPSPDIQDAVASTCFVLDSVSGLKE